MRALVVFVIAAVLLVLAFAGFRLWQFSKLWPKPSTEITTLTSANRAQLSRLRAEHKFQPHSFPPLGYTGTESPEDEATAQRAVNGVIDKVLARPNGALPAKVVSSLIGDGMKTVRLLPTEDRERTQDYMLEVWYLLGFKGPTGRFAYGSYYKTPAGYGEPLPPGWTSPAEPRPFAH